MSDSAYLRAHADQTDLTFGQIARKLAKQDDEMRQLRFLLSNLDQKLDQIIAREGLY